MKDKQQLQSNKHIRLGLMGRSRTRGITTVGQQNKTIKKEGPTNIQIGRRAPKPQIRQAALVERQVNLIHEELPERRARREIRPCGGTLAVGTPRAKPAGTASWTFLRDCLHLRSSTPLHDMISQKSN